VVLLNVVMTLVIYKWIILPVTRLRDSAREIAKGKYDIRVKVLDNDEIGELAYSFNAMSAEIERNVGSLNEANRKLERLATSSRDFSTGVVFTKSFRWSWKTSKDTTIVSASSWRI
jgi:two-component system sensor histidine kinase ResE